MGKESAATRDACQLDTFLFGPKDLTSGTNQISRVCKTSHCVDVGFLLGFDDRRLSVFAQPQLVNVDSIMSTNACARVYSFAKK